IPAIPYTGCSRSHSTSPSSGVFVLAHYHLNHAIIDSPLSGVGGPDHSESNRLQSLYRTSKLPTKICMSVQGKSSPSYFSRIFSLCRLPAVYIRHRAPISGCRTTGYSISEVVPCHIFRLFPTDDLWASNY
ncbi:unnamed protein product, partial [Acanthoscelides obtectus]